MFEAELSNPDAEQRQAQDSVLQHVNEAVAWEAAAGREAIAAAKREAAATARAEAAAVRALQAEIDTQHRFLEVLKMKGRLSMRGVFD